MRRISLVEMLAIVFIIFGTVNQEKVPENMQGRDFIIGFLENRVLTEYPVIHVIVTSASTIDVTVTISVPLDSSFPTKQAVIEPGKNLVHQYYYSLHMKGTALEYKGVRVQASGDVTVQGASINDLSSDAFLAFPKQGLGLDHYVMCYLYTEESGNAQGPSQLGIIGVYPGTEVTLTFAQDFQLDVKAIRQSPRVYRLVLGKYETLQVQGAIDLTGTRVQSTRPVAVISGSVWSSVGVEYMGDHMTEQIPPVNSWGQEFYTIPLATRTAGDVFRILAHVEQTSVYVSATDYGGSGVSEEHVLNAGEFFDLEADSTESYHIVGSNALLLAQFCKGNGADGNRFSDPFISLLPPVDQYTNDYHFSTVSPLYSEIEQYNHFVGVSVRASSVENVFLDDRPLLARPVVLRLYHNATSRLIITVTVPDGPHRLYSMSTSAGFGAILYGFKFQEAYGLPLGQQLEVLQHACSPVEMKLNDEFDNDCDGFIDEELDNGEDDDRDGLIDEDIGDHTTSLPVSPDISTTTVPFSELDRTTSYGEKSADDYSASTKVFQTNLNLPDSHPTHTTRTRGKSIGTGSGHSVTTRSLNTDQSNSKIVVTSELTGSTSNAKALENIKMNTILQTVTKKSLVFGYKSDHTPSNDGKQTTMSNDFTTLSLYLLYKTKSDPDTLSKSNSEGVSGRMRTIFTTGSTDSASQLASSISTDLKPGNQDWISHTYNNQQTNPVTQTEYTTYQEKTERVTRRETNKIAKSEIIMKTAMTGNQINSITQSYDRGEVGVTEPSAKRDDLELTSYSPNVGHRAKQTTTEFKGNVIPIQTDSDALTSSGIFGKSTNDEAVNKLDEHVTFTMETATMQLVINQGVISEPQGPDGMETAGSRQNSYTTHGNVVVVSGIGERSTETLTAATTEQIHKDCDGNPEDECPSVKQKLESQILLAIIIPVIILVGVPTLVCCYLCCTPIHQTCNKKNRTGNQPVNKGSQEKILPSAAEEINTLGKLTRKNPPKLTFSAFSPNTKVSMIDQASMPNGEPRKSKRTNRKAQESKINSINDIPLESRQQRRQRKYGNRADKPKKANVSASSSGTGEGVILAMPKSMKRQ